MNIVKCLYHGFCVSQDVIDLTQLFVKCESITRKKKGVFCFLLIR